MVKFLEWSRLAGERHKMNTTDPIADMLTRVRNAGRAGLKYTVVPASTMKVELTKILEQEGFVRGFRLIRDSGQGKIKIAIKYTDSGESVIRGIVKISTPGCRVYKKVDELPRVRGGLGMSILSTPKGILTDASARVQRVGGEVLAQVW
jgi:small subunit ribosomal protein S8